MIVRKFPREVLEGAVRILADKYPACFLKDLPADLPPVVYGDPLPAAPAAPVDPLARLQKLMETGAALYADTDDEALRTALAVTVLKQLRDEAAKAIAILEPRQEGAE
jgi:hypothetical protein